MAEEAAGAPSGTRELRTPTPRALKWGALDSIPGWLKNSCRILSWLVLMYPRQYEHGPQGEMLKSQGQHVTCVCLPRASRRSRRVLTEASALGPVWTWPPAAAVRAEQRRLQHRAKDDVGGLSTPQRPPSPRAGRRKRGAPCLLPCLGVSGGAGESHVVSGVSGGAGGVSGGAGGSQAIRSALKPPSTRLWRPALCSPSRPVSSTSAKREGPKHLEIGLNGKGQQRAAPVPPAGVPSLPVPPGPSPGGEHGPLLCSQRGLGQPRCRFGAGPRSRAQLQLSASGQGWPCARIAPSRPDRAAATAIPELRTCAGTRTLLAISARSPPPPPWAPAQRPPASRSFSSLEKFAGTTFHSPGVTSAPQISHADETALTV